MVSQVITEINQALGPGVISSMEEEQGARKRSVPALIRNGQSVTNKAGNPLDSTYLQCLDVATAFRKITIKDIKYKAEQKCKHCRLIQYKCPVFM